jgi:hypothetical protein
LIEISSKSTTNTPFTLKLPFPSSIKISRRFGTTSAKASNRPSPEGREMDESDEQLRNA